MMRNSALIRLAVLGFVVGALMLAGCTSSPKIYTDYDPAASKRGFQTYGFFPRLGTDEANYSSLVTQHLKSAVAGEMESRGYRQSNNPDLLVNFYVHAQDKVRVTSVPTPTGYYGYRGGYYGGWGGYSYDTHVNEYTEGTLNIDVVDAANKQLVWQGVAVATVRESDRQEPKPVIESAVTAMFAEYPFSAGR